jgi:hypothetical protein
MISSASISQIDLAYLFCSVGKFYICVVPFRANLLNSFIGTKCASLY